jgi:hypothetical protein
MAGTGWLAAYVVAGLVDDGIPLEDLVTPASLAAWQALFANPEQREEAVTRLQYHGVSLPRVVPQPDGTLGIALPWVHPDQTEVLELTEPTALSAYMAYLELVAEPDDWRVHRIGDPAGY